jgi:hypothetical protein
MSTTPRTRLVVYTTRLHSRLDDPDTLDITRRTADAHEKAIPGWRDLTIAARDALRMDGIDRARACSARRLTLVQTQRHALDNGLPSLGAAWAPSWDLLRPALEGLKLAAYHGNKALTLPADERAAAITEALRLEDLAWDQYITGWTRDGVVVPGFVEQMKASWYAHKAAWRWLLGREKVALGCLCSRPKWWPLDRPWAHCHRFEVARLLAKCDATYMGELEEPEAPPSPQLGFALG